jgi:predicted dinucleotide-binding enzyme
LRPVPGLSRRSIRSSPSFNEGLIKNGRRRVIFVSGDHVEPTDFVKSLIESYGFTPIYLGGLATGGRLQQSGGPFAGRDLVDFGSR